MTILLERIGLMPGTDPKTEYKNLFGEELHRLRTAVAKVSLKTLAQRVADAGEPIDLSYIAKLEKGTVRSPDGRINVSHQKARALFKAAGGKPYDAIRLLRESGPSSAAVSTPDIDDLISGMEVLTPVGQDFVRRQIEQLINSTEEFERKMKEHGAVEEDSRPSLKDVNDEVISLAAALEIQDDDEE